MTGWLAAPLGQPAVGGQGLLPPLMPPLVPPPDDRIVSDPTILGGKPCVKGTRLSVEFLLELLASGASQADIIQQYPQLTIEDVAAALRYAAHSLKLAE